MRLEIAPTPADAGQLAGRLLGAVLAVAIRKRGRACVALSGGSTPEPLYAALASQVLDWSAVHVFQVDERVTPRGDSARNLTLLEDLLVNRGPLSRRNLHPMWVERADLDDAAAAYEAELREFAGEPPALDAIHLGLGTDGHTASLFSGDPALQVQEQGVAATGEHAGYRRLTLTLPLINRARSIIWFITGAGKAELLEELRAGGGPFPGARVSRRRAVIVADAAALLRAG